MTLERVERRKDAGSAETVRRAKYVSLADNGGRRLSSLEDEQGGGQTASTVCVNDRYAFFLTRGRAGAPWLLDRVDLQPPASEDAELAGRPLRQTWKNAFPWLTLNPNLQLIDLITSPTFQIIETPVRQSNASDGELRYKFLATITVRRFLKEEYSGWLQFDPTRDWALTGYNLTVTNVREGRAVATFLAVYDDGRKRLAVPRSMVMTHKGFGLQGELLTESTTEHAIRFDDAECPPPAEFELPAYGLPEPFGVKPRRNRQYVYVIVLGLAAVVAGRYLVRWASNRPRGVRP